VSRRLNLLLIESFNDFSIVLFNSNKSHKFQSVKERKTRLFNQLDVILDFLLVVLSCLFKGINLLCCLKLNQSLSDLSCPSHLSASNEYLTLSRSNDFQ